MRAGRLRHRGTILTAPLVQNSFGEMAQNWATATRETVWGELLPILSRAREEFAERAGQIQAKAPYQWRMRQKAVSPVTNRLEVDGRTFEIEAVLDPDGRDRETVAICYEVQA